MVSFNDRLTFQMSEEDHFTADVPGWTAEESLVFRAVKLLQKAVSYPKGARIEISKSIPPFSGLGGDSSDAAATLCGLNRLWGLKLPRNTLLELAAELGTDVPSFIYGGTVLAEGRGEKVIELKPFPYTHFVILLPGVERGHGKTERVYGHIRKSHYTDGGITERLVSLIYGSEDMELVMNELGLGREGFSFLLFNIFDNVAFECFEGLKDYWQEFQGAGAKVIHLAGSGPAIYTLCQTEEEAKQIYRRLKERGLECYLAHTLESTGNCLREA